MSSGRLPTLALSTVLLACSSAAPVNGSGTSSTSSGSATGGSPSTASGSGSSSHASSVVTAGAGGGTSSTGNGGAAFVEAPHRAWPQVPKTGSGLMTSPRLVLIVPDDETPANAAAYKALVTAVPSSTWYATWSPPYGLGAGRAGQSANGPVFPASSQVDASTASSYLDSALAAADPTLAPDGQTTYVLVLPVGSTLAVAPTPTDVFGIHWSYGGGGDGLAVISVATDGSSPLKRTSAVITHEIAEAETDTGPGWRTATLASMKPWTQSVWNLWEGEGPAGGYLEIGDFCEGTRYAEGSLWFQRIYANAAAAKGDDPCVPALPVPYFNVSTPDDWYPSAKGAPVTLPLTGWSTAPTSDFLVSVAIAAQSSATDPWTVTIDTPRTGTFAGMTSPILNNAEAATAVVTPPVGAASGSWVIVSFWTWHEEANGDVPPGEDTAHLFATGVYVP